MHPHRGAVRLVELVVEEVDDPLEVVDAVARGGVPGGPVAVLLGVVTGVAGGILRDVLTGEVPLVFQPQIYLYATAALAGSTAFVLLHRWSPNQSALAVICIALILGLRLVGIRLKLSLPVLESEESQR